MDAWATTPPTPYPAARTVSRALRPSLREQVDDGDGRGREAVHAGHPSAAASHREEAVLLQARRVGIVWPEASRGRLVASFPGAPFSDDRAAAPPRFPGAPCGRRGPRS